MFILDTNVVSELRKAKAGKADANVVAWAEDQDPSALFLSAITLLELEMGVRQMERRDSTQGAVLRAWMADRVLPVFEGRILPVDGPVALCCAALHVHRYAQCCGLRADRRADHQPMGADAMTPSNPTAIVLRTERAILEGIRAKDHRRCGERCCLNRGMARQKSLAFSEPRGSRDDRIAL